MRLVLWPSDSCDPGVPSNIHCPTHHIPRRPHAGLAYPSPVHTTAPAVSSLTLPLWPSPQRHPHGGPGGPKPAPRSQQAPCPVPSPCPSSHSCAAALQASGPALRPPTPSCAALLPHTRARSAAALHAALGQARGASALCGRGAPQAPRRAMHRRRPRQLRVRLQRGCHCGSTTPLLPSCCLRARFITSPAHARAAGGSATDGHTLREARPGAIGDPQASHPTAHASWGGQPRHTPITRNSWLTSRMHAREAGTTLLTHAHMGLD